MAIAIEQLLDAGQLRDGLVDLGFRAPEYGHSGGYYRPADGMAVRLAGYYQTDYSGILAQKIAVEALFISTGLYTPEVEAAWPANFAALVKLVGGPKFK